LIRENEDKRSDIASAAKNSEYVIYCIVMKITGNRSKFKQTIINWLSRRLII